MQSTLDITVHPLDLSSHGRNPKGQPLFRIVWADSRVDKMLHHGRIVEMPRYEFCKGKWILEKWRSTKDLYGITREQWEALMAQQPFGSGQMEYDPDGDYEHSHTFAGSVDPTEAHDIATKIEAGLNNYTAAERLQALRDSHESAAKVVDQKMTEILQSVLNRGVIH